jgi:predicted nucleic acid-binding protein
VIVLDTSVLVAALIGSHKFHGPSVELFRSVKNGRLKGGLGIHSLAELYSALTNYPSEPRLPPSVAEKMIAENISTGLQMIELTPADYRAAMRRASERNLRGGAVYDSLILQAAIKKRAEALYTWNRTDFDRLAGKEMKILEP